MSEICYKFWMNTCITLPDKVNTLRGCLYFEYKKKHFQPAIYIIKHVTDSYVTSVLQWMCCSLTCSYLLYMYVFTYERKKPYPWPRIPPPPHIHTHTRTHARTHTRTHAHTYTHTHARTHTTTEMVKCSCLVYISDNIMHIFRYLW